MFFEIAGRQCWAARLELVKSFELCCKELEYPKQANVRTIEIFPPPEVWDPFKMRKSCPVQTVIVSLRIDWHFWRTRYCKEEGKRQRSLRKVKKQKTCDTYAAEFTSEAEHLSTNTNTRNIYDTTVGWPRGSKMLSPYSPPMFPWKLLVWFKRTCHVI